MNNNESKINSKKKKEHNNLETINYSKSKQNQIKKYLLYSKDIISISNNNIAFNKNKKIELENIDKKKEEYKKRNIKDQNTTEIKANENNKVTKNKKVDNIKIEEINKENCIISNTNRDFYNKHMERNKSFNFYDESNIFRNKINNNKNHLFYILNDNNKNKKKTNLISVRSFNKNKEYFNKHIFNSENINFNNPHNQDINNFSFYDNNMINNINIFEGKNKISTFKNIKTFYAHLEILISLYLKRNFEYFIKKIKNNKNQLKNGKTDNYEKINNKNASIINVNNAHCSLFCSININQDNNKLFNTIFNNISTPLTKRDKIRNENSQLLNNIRKNKLLFINPENDVNLSTYQKFEKEINKSVYFPKNKITKFNTDLINEIKPNEIYVDNKKIKFNKNINNNIKKSSPIKEMNINLKKINVCRLNELNKLYYNQNLLKNKSFNNISISEMNNILNMKGIGHSKYNSNIIQINDNFNNNNGNIDKIKLKKISSVKNNIYIKAKEKSNKTIKEIKIQNSKNKLSPFKKYFYNKKINNIKTDNLIESSRLKDSHLYSTNNDNNLEKSIIKKIYIRRNSNIKNKNNINYNESDELNEILIKQLKTKDKRMFINIKYFNINNYLKIKKNYNLKSLKNEQQCSILIMKNKIKIKLNKNNNIIKDIYLFDNDNKERNKKNKNKKSKHISFSLKENISSKKKINIKIIKCFKKIILNKNNKILKYYFEIFKNEKNKNRLINDKIGVYHKINYNDDYNLNKRIKTPNNFKQNNNIHCKSKAYNLTSKNYINQKINNNNKRRRRELSSSINFNEINITVHNNKGNNISTELKLKKKIFLFRIKLIKNAFKD